MIGEKEYWDQVRGPRHSADVRLRFNTLNIHRILRFSKATKEEKTPTEKLVLFMKEQCARPGSTSLDVDIMSILQTDWKQSSKE